MTIDWIHFTPWPALAGGVLLGAAAGLLIVLNGRILGISDIIGGLITPKMGEITWRITFLAGMAAAPWVFSLLAPAGYLQAPRMDTDLGLLIVAGLLVGLGSRYGSGCTSGHGVCGLSRLSPRSLIATATFMATGFITVYLMRHVI